MFSLENRKPSGHTTAALPCKGRLPSSPNLLAEVPSKEMRGDGLDKGKAFSPRQTVKH